MSRVPKPQLETLDMQVMFASLMLNPDLILCPVRLSRGV